MSEDKITPHHWAFDKLYPGIRYYYEWYADTPGSTRSRLPMKCLKRFGWAGPPPIRATMTFWSPTASTPVVNIRAERDDDVDFLPRP